jgi:hypothetical protein
MNEDTSIKKLEELQFLPKNLKELIKERVCKITSSIITKERVANLYGLRKQNNIEDDKYSEVIAELNTLLKNLESEKEKIVMMFNIIGSSVYVTIFTNIQVEQIIGILNLTGLGNTDLYMRSQFP